MADRSGGVQCARAAPAAALTAGLSRAEAVYGWVPPLAWEDDTLDEATAGRTGAGYTRPRFGVLRRLLEDPVELAAQVNQGGVRAVAARHRVTPAAAQAALTRSGYRARLRAGGHVWARTSA